MSFSKMFVSSTPKPKGLFARTNSPQCKCASLFTLLFLALGWSLRRRRLCRSACVVTFGYKFKRVLCQVLAQMDCWPQAFGGQLNVAMVNVGNCCSHPPSLNSYSRYACTLCTWWPAGKCCHVAQLAIGCAIPIACKRIWSGKNL